MGFVSIISHAHQLVEASVAPNDIVIDATVGNGLDTLFLTKLVVPRGKIYGFDIQQEALQKAKERIAAENLDPSNINLLHQSHANMLQCIPQAEQGHISAIMFNLGYLPGHSHEIITRPESTLPALEASIQMLKKDGLITIIVYPGHPGGQEEADQVSTWAKHLPQKHLQVLNYQFLNQKNHPPFLIAIKKR